MDSFCPLAGALRHCLRNRDTDPTIWCAVEGATGGQNLPTRCSFVAQSQNSAVVIFQQSSAHHMSESNIQAFQRSIYLLSVVYAFQLSYLCSTSGFLGSKNDSLRACQCTMQLLPPLASQWWLLNAGIVVYGLRHFMHETKGPVDLGWGIAFAKFARYLSVDSI